MARKLFAVLLILSLCFGIVGGVLAGEAGGDKVKLKIQYGYPQDEAAESAWNVFNDYIKPTVEAQFPNIEFEWFRWTVGSDYRQQYDQLLLAKEEPTLGMTFPYVDIQTRIANGTIAEITEFVEAWELKKEGKVTAIYDHALSTADGKWYAVPGQPYVSGLVYNKQVIEEAGLDPNIDMPVTWTEFAELAASITDKDVPRFGYLLLGSEWNAWTFTPWVWAAGGEMVRPNGDGTWAIAFNEDAGVDAAMFMNELMWKYNACQTNVLESYDDMQNNFKSGLAAFTWNSPAGFSEDDLAKYDQSQANLGIFPLPAKDDGGRMVGFAGGEVWTLSPNATDAQRAAAWEVINFLSYDPAYLEGLWEKENEQGRLAATPSARVDLTALKFSKGTSWPAHWAEEFSKVSEVALPEPYCPNWNELKNEIVIPLQTIYLKEGITREEVRQLLDDCAELLYKTYPASFQKP